MNERRWWHGALCAYGVLSLSSMAGMSLGGGFFLAVSLVLLFRSTSRRGELLRLFRSPLGWVSLGLFAVSALSLVAASFAPPAGVPASGFKELSKFHHFLYPFFLALAFAEGPEPMEEHPFWKWWIGMGLFSALLALLQFWGGALFPNEWLSSRFFRAVGHSGHFHGQGLMFFHLSFAACISFFAAAGLARFLWPRAGDRRWLWLGIGFSGLAGVFFSYSRISWIAIGVLVVLLGALKRPLWGLVGLVLVLGSGVVAWNLSDTLRARVEENRNGNEDRFNLWRVSLEMAGDRPLSGVGFGRTGRYSEIYLERMLGEKPRFSSHAHNNFLDALASSGWPGLLVFLGWWGVVIGGAWVAFRRAAENERWLPAACLGGFVAFHVNGLTQVNFWDGKSQHTLMLWVGISLALWARSSAQRLKASR